MTEMRRHKHMMLGFLLFLLLGMMSTLRAEEEAPVPIDERTMDLIEARLASRFGFTGTSLRLYADLRRRYPADMDIWEDMIETLIDTRDYERALAELADMRRSRPVTPRAARLEARVYIETHSYENAVKTIEDILASTPRNAGVLADSGYIRTSRGDRAGALNEYAAVLELDPENDAVRDAVHELLRELRPRLNVGYRRDLKSAHARLNTWSAGITGPLGNRGDFTMSAGRVFISRPQRSFSARIDEEVGSCMLRLGRRLDERWHADLGLGGYSGMGGGPSPTFGLTYERFPSLTLRMSYAHHQPWYDPIEAAGFDGYQNSAAASMEWIHHGRWIIGAAMENVNYYADPGAGGNSSYGRKQSGTLSISRRLFLKPETAVGYSITRSSFSYAHGTDENGARPIGMLTSETIHSFFLSSLLRCNAYMDINLNGGYAYDTSRSAGSWYGMSSLNLRLRNRMELSGGYEYIKPTIVVLLIMNLGWIW